MTSKQVFAVVTPMLLSGIPLCLAGLAGHNGDYILFAVLLWVASITATLCPALLVVLFIGIQIDKMYRKLESLIRELKATGQADID